MTNSQRLATVRACLLGWIASQADPDGDSSEPNIDREAILIRDEFYCGRRFHTAHYQAVWFIEEDELKIYRSSGQLVRIFSSQQISEHGCDPSDHRSPDVIKMAPHASDEDPETGSGQQRRAA
jgi:hypothetical protein